MTRPRWRRGSIELLFAYALFLLAVLGVHGLILLADDPPATHTVLQGKFEGEWVLASGEEPADVPSHVRFVVEEWFQQHPPAMGQLLVEDWARGAVWIDGEPSRFLLETWVNSSWMFLDGGARRIQIEVRDRWLHPVRLRVDWTYDDELTWYTYRRAEG